MRMRMLTAIAASAMCFAAASGAEAGGHKHDGHRAWKDHHHHNHNHHNGHHGSGRSHHQSAGRETGRGCDDHWDSNPAFRPSLAFSQGCLQPGLGVTIIGIPGMWGDWRGYGY